MLYGIVSEMEEVYDNIALEQIAKTKFGIQLDVDQVIVRQVPVSRSSRATVFLTVKKQLFCLVSGQQNLTLGDVKKAVTRMGLKAELYVPPKGWPTYFDDIGIEHFKSVFPGRTHVTPDDLMYYRTLAPYNPALVQIKEIPSGEISQYDADARGSWRPSAKFTYRRIKTS